MIQQTFSLASFEYFLLIFIRIASFTFVAPFFSLRGFPVRTRIGFSAVIAILVANSISPVEMPYVSAIGYSVLVVKEIICGLLIGFVCNICMSIITFSGSLIDMNIGLSMVSEFDPTMNTQMTVSGQFYYYFMLLLMLASNLHKYILSALIDSFTMIPLGGADFAWDNIVSVLVIYLADYLQLGFRIMLPIFACMLVANVVLGVMAKVAPQMNMFSVGVQIKILIGFAAMFLTVFLFPEVVSMVSDEMKKLLPGIMESMY